MNIIVRVKISSGPALDLAFADGTSGTFSLRPLIDAGGVFVALRDPETVARVQIGEGGRFVEWPGGIDLCADALWLAIREATGAAA